MIFLTHYPEIEDVVNTSEGIHTTFIYAAEIVPQFVPMMLFSLFIIVALGGYFAQLRISGRGNFAVSFTAGAFVTTVSAFVLSIVPHLVPISVLLTCVGILIVGVIWLMFSGRE